MIKLYTGWRPLLSSDLSVDRCSKDEALRTHWDAEVNIPDGDGVTLPDQQRSEPAPVIASGSSR